MRYIRLIHKWTGLTVGLFFMLSCLSGLLIVFGKVIGSYSPIFKIAKEFHTSYMIGDVGEKILGVATLLALIEIATGYILWCRRTLALSRSLKKRGKNPWEGLWKNVSFTFPDKLSGLHVAGGFWAGVPLLIMILTALTWCFGWYSDLIYYLFDSAGTDSWNDALFHKLHNLHAGSWGGLISRLIWLVAVALGALLSISGYLIWCRRRR